MHVERAYVHIHHSASCLPPTHPPYHPPPQKKKKTLHNHCFQFLLVITVVPREIEDNGYAIYIYIFFGGVGGGGGTRCIIAYVKMVNNLSGCLQLTF